MRVFDLLYTRFAVSLIQSHNIMVPKCQPRNWDDVSAKDIPFYYHGAWEVMVLFVKFCSWSDKMLDLLDLLVAMLVSTITSLYDFTI